MPVYDIYVLEENALSLSGGAVLDGVTQGDGSHLTPAPPDPPITLTLNSATWVPISIDDVNSNFEDNGGNQRLDGPATLNGTTFADNTRVEAEYGITVSDGTNTWTLVGFNVNNSSPAYGTVEGLAFIGGPGGFPPVGVPLTITSAFEGPNFAAADYATPICMASGTLVETPAGARAIEDIAVGDVVLTRDHGPQVVRWHGARRVMCTGRFAPVRFEAGAIGNTRALVLSQQHRVLIEGWQAELLFGAEEVLVPAVHLLNDHSIRLVRQGQVTYHHVLLDCHAVLNTEGAWSESLCLGEEALKALLPAARAEILALFPELGDGGVQAQGRLGYPAIKCHEAQLLRIG